MKEDLFREAKLCPTCKVKMSLTQTLSPMPFIWECHKCGHFETVTTKVYDKHKTYK